MTATVKIQTVSQAVPQDWRWKVRWWEDIVFGAVPALVLAPLAALEFGHLWTRLHMRLFPVPIIAVVVLAALNWKSQRSESSERVVSAYCLQIITIVCVLANWFSFSPWLAHLCLIPVFASWALQRFGDVPWPRIAAWSLLLATSMRLPNNLDVQLLAWLEHSATSLVTLSLDGLSQPYLLEGGKLTVSGPDPMYVLEFNIEHTVRNALSLNSLCALCVWLLTCGRRSFITGSVMLATIPLWYLMMVAMQLLAIVAGMHYCNMDLSAGRKLLCLSCFTFTLIACLLWLTERFMWKLLHPVPPLDSQFEQEFRVLNWFMVWPQADPFNDFDHDRSRVAKCKPSLPSPRWLSIHLVARRVCLSCLLVGAVASLILTNRAIADARNVRPLPAISTKMLTEVGSKDSLPNEIADWKCVGFDRNLHIVDSVARGQLKWKYAWQDQILELKVSFPFAANSDLTNELAENGWRVFDQRDGEFHLENELGGNALAMFADQSIGQTGQSEQFLLHYHVSLLCEYGDELSNEQMEVLRESFRLALTLVSAAVDKPIANVLEGSR